MASSTPASPLQVVSRPEWLTARLSLLAEEKALSRARDAVASARRALPVVEITKPYTFHTLSGTPITLAGLFAGRRQLIVYHYMFSPTGSAGCSSCSVVADNFGHLSHINSRDTTLVAISRAPASKIAQFQQRMGWDFPWYSSNESDFNYDFDVTLDGAVKPESYNYMSTEETVERFGTGQELPGISVFLRDGERVFHTWSGYGRQIDMVINTYQYLDLTKLGRQEEDMEVGMFGFTYHDKYE
ncbi:DUF899-domain-containing protein [Lepidopterella palustris CBS 459.81]|uniref:DUF899-domain-containing protein n=1 Tax=Lepidopterella palustris CBS 459.81 TaxID=1314670 RepID=A0A8E2EE36_9PEZI|nr:DUF899-domain-containing protein [Lepidopterella palustris CBS 459.81]